MQSLVLFLQLLRYYLLLIIYTGTQHSALVNHYGLETNDKKYKNETLRVWDVNLCSNLSNHDEPMQQCRGNFINASVVAILISLFKHSSHPRIVRIRSRKYPNGFLKRAAKVRTLLMTHVAKQCFPFYISLAVKTRLPLYVSVIEAVISSPSKVGCLYVSKSRLAAQAKFPPHVPLQELGYYCTKL